MKKKERERGRKWKKQSERERLVKQADGQTGMLKGVFRPANGCLACHALVKFIFFSIFTFSPQYLFIYTCSNQMEHSMTDVPP